MLARYILDTTKDTPAKAANNSAIPEKYRREVEARLENEVTTELIPSQVVTDGKVDQEWLDNEDRNTWYYWPCLRAHLTVNKNWPTDRIRSLDDASDKVLQNINQPTDKPFDTRGLVIGYVQSGKTANYTSLMAKAADVGYRLFIVLSGMDNGLRRQTQIRLERELVGNSKEAKQSVKLPPPGKQWHVFTSDEMYGDFQPGNVNTAALQGAQPVLMVVKKNVHVLQKILDWLSSADKNTIRLLPTLVIDDEADQASIDTRGTGSVEDERPECHEKPSVINGLIRQLLNQFTHRSFVAYTATPFANILIPVNQSDTEYGTDLYPSSFIMALPKPKSYVGAEELFGRSGLTGEKDSGDGIDVFRPIPDEDISSWEIEQEIPESLKQAIVDFVLAGAAKNKRDADKEPPERTPSTMLVHTSRLTNEHSVVETVVRLTWEGIRDDWRYNQGRELKDAMERQWNEDFCPTTKDCASSRIISFRGLKDYIGPFLESIQVKIINSETGDVLDYEAEPNATTIAIGGNKLSRGLTLEGLLVSYFTRESGGKPTYDTVMQMGRWFGFREDYVDLTRLYMTRSLADVFSHLAVVEQNLRDDMAIYADKKVTPREYGMRILAHPAMEVTSFLKRRYAEVFRTSYSGTKFQTFRFPLKEPQSLVEDTKTTLQATKDFLSTLGYFQRKQNHFLWTGIAANTIVAYLKSIKNTEHVGGLLDVAKYIEERVSAGELTDWTVVISQLQKPKQELQSVDWGIGKDIEQFSRTRLLKTANSLGVISDPKDFSIDLSQEDVERAKQELDSVSCNKSQLFTIARSPNKGLLLLYPISKYSQPSPSKKGSRGPLYDDPDDVFSKNLIGVAIPFPYSDNAEQKIYVSGTSSWQR